MLALWHIIGEKGNIPFFAAQEIMEGKSCVRMETEGNDTNMNTVIPKASYFICMQQYRLPHLRHYPRRGLYCRWVQGGALGRGGHY